MKKMFLCLAVFMVTASSFAWKGTFITSCGVVLTINNPRVNQIDDVINFLQWQNGMTCGTSNVTISFH